MRTLKQSSNSHQSARGMLRYTRVRVMCRNGDGQIAALLVYTFHAIWIPSSLVPHEANYYPVGLCKRRHGTTVITTCTTRRRRHCHRRATSGDSQVDRRSAQQCREFEASVATQPKIDSNNRTLGDVHGVTSNVIKTYIRSTSVRCDVTS